MKRRLSIKSLVIFAILVAVVIFLSDILFDAVWSVWEKDQGNLLSEIKSNFANQFRLRKVITPLVTGVICALVIRFLNRRS